MLLLLRTGVSGEAARAKKWTTGLELQDITVSQVDQFD